MFKKIIMALLLIKTRGIATLEKEGIR